MREGIVWIGCGGLTVQLGQSRRWNHRRSSKWTQDVGVLVPDVVFVLVILAGFSLLALIAKGVERL